MHFVLITGPPAVGKMTVAQSLRDLTGFRMFHNHMSIELALNFFDWGDAGFKAINEGIRQLIFKTIAGTKDIKGFIFTLVIGMDLPEDWEYVDNLRKQFESEGWDLHIVELEAPQSIRLERNKTENRLLHKPSKRDIQESEVRLIRFENEERMTSREGEFANYSYLKIHNDNLSPIEAAKRIVKHFDLDNPNDVPTSNSSK